MIKRQINSNNQAPDKLHLDRYEDKSQLGP